MDKQSLQNEEWDEGIVINPKKKSYDTLVATGDEIQQVIRLLHTPIKDFQGHLFNPPLQSQDHLCNFCQHKPVCQKRCKSKLPVMCETVFAADVIFIERIELETLKELQVIQ